MSVRADIAGRLCAGKQRVENLYVRGKGMFGRARQ